MGSAEPELETVRDAPEKVFAPVNVCVPLRCAVSESKYAEAIAVPCQVPALIVPSPVIFD